MNRSPASPDAGFFLARVQSRKTVRNQTPLAACQTHRNRCDTGGLMRPSLLFPVFTLSIAGALADTPLNNRVSLSEQASIELENAQMVATLFAQAEGLDTGTPARKVNRTIRQAVNRARQHPGIEVSTSTTTHSRRPHRTLAGVPAGLHREPRQPDTEPDDQRAAVREPACAITSYRLPEEKRRQHIDSMIEQALQHFTHRARHVTTTLGGKDYRLVQLSVNEGRPGPTPIRMETMMASSGLAR